MMVHLKATDTEDTSLRMGQMTESLRERLPYQTAIVTRGSSPTLRSLLCALGFPVGHTAIAGVRHISEQIPCHGGKIKFSISKQG